MDLLADTHANGTPIAIQLQNDCSVAIKESTSFIHNPSWIDLSAVGKRSGWVTTLHLRVVYTTEIFKQQQVSSFYTTVLV